MPTLIGRFNELLLHNISSSSLTTASVTTPVTANNHASTVVGNGGSSTGNTRQQHNNNNNLPVRTNSNRNAGSHHHHHQKQQHGSNNRNRQVKRSISNTNRSSTTNNNNNNNKTISSSMVGRSESSNDAPHSNRHHRAGLGSSSSRHHHQHHNHHQQQQQINQASKRMDSSGGVDATGGSDHNHNNKQQVNNHSQQKSHQHLHHHQHHHHARRHSIPSIGSLSNQNNLSSHGSGVGGGSANNSSVMFRRFISLLQNKNGKRTENNDIPDNGTKKICHEKEEITVMKNSIDPVVVVPDESFSRMLVRKMKFRTRKNSNQSNTFRKKLKFLKLSRKESESNSIQWENKGCFINLYLDGHLTKNHPDIVCGKTCYDMPVIEIAPLETRVVATDTGPGNGLLAIKQVNQPFQLADDIDFIDEDDNCSSIRTDSDPTTTEKFSNSSVSSSGVTGETVTTINESVNGTEKLSGTQQRKQAMKKGQCKEQVAGVDDWHRSSDFAYGIATTLYELHPSSKRNAGDPIADSYGICVRENSAIIALADGVNWGEKASLASRCAVHGCIDYLNKALCFMVESMRPRNTMSIFVALLRSFQAAHSLILSQGGYLTTLCAAVICQLKDSDRFIVCTCNVGDSLAYVYSSKYGVREITQGSHDIFSMRDMRDALGALGPVSGSQPELSNLTVAMTIVDVGDIVFLTSDGISDNFDPVVGKFAVPRKEPKPDENGNGENGNGVDRSCIDGKMPPKESKGLKIVKRSNSNPESSRQLNYTSKGLPLVSAQQRHDLTLLRMEDLIMNGVNDDSFLDPSVDHKLTAKELCMLMVDFSRKLTMAKRRILEDPELYSDEENDADQEDVNTFDKERSRRRTVGPKLALVPGKLDHASIAAVEVGFYGKMRAKKGHLYSNKNGQQTTMDRHSSMEARYDLKRKPTLARFESLESIE